MSLVRLRSVWMTNHPPSVLWHCWLGHQTCKNRRPYNLYCVGADVKPCSINQSITQAQTVWPSRAYQSNFSTTTWIWSAVNSSANYVQKIVACCKYRLLSKFFHFQLFANIIATPDNKIICLFYYNFSYFKGSIATCRERRLNRSSLNVVTHGASVSFRPMGVSILVSLS